MSGILTPGERTGQWEVAGDLTRRVRALEAVDPCACFDCGTTLAEAILAIPNLGAFWKLNESDGTTAHDSFDGHDMEPRLGGIPPTWGDPDIIEGDTSSLWPIGLPEGSEHVGTLSAYTDNFTAGIWVYGPSGLGALQGECIGQGTPLHVSGGSTGWCIYFSTSTGTKVFFGNGSSMSANSLPVLDTIYFLAVVRDAGTWKLYVNGVEQTATSTTTPGAGSTDTWIGNDGFASHGTYAQGIRLAYGFIAGSVMTEADILELYNLGILGSAGVIDGYVWTALGDCTADWRPAMIEILENGV